VQNMTMTVKIDAPLERALRSRCASVGRTASAVIRDALQSYLAQTELPAPSAYELGKDLFGLYGDPVNLASDRKAELAKIGDEKRPLQVNERKVARRGKT
jgi:plasmid stability protein